MNGNRRRELARETASTLAFLFVMLILTFLVLTDTSLTAPEARLAWVVVGLALVVPTVLCWLYCQVAPKESRQERRNRTQRR